MSDRYCERVWLNPEGHPSTGSAVAYDGPGNWGLDTNTTFLEISDCNNAVRLHLGGSDTIDDMIDKMQKLQGVVGRFIEYLEEKKAKGGSAAVAPPSKPVEAE